MVDDDKKKDLDSEYSALSDALENGDPAPSLEDLLKDHGIDLGSDIDLDAMQDFSFSEKPASSDPIDRDTRATEDFDKDLFNDELFKEDLFKEDLFKEDLFKVKEDLHKEDLFKEDLFKEDAFHENLFDEPDAPSMPPPRAKHQAEPLFEPMEPTDVDDTTIFESSDFDDVTEGGSNHDLGDDPLFDYDPQGEATFADVGGADDLGGDGTMGGDMPPPDKGPGAKRIFARLGMMLVMVSVIYGGLKLFLGEKSPETVAEAPQAQVAPSQIAKLSAPAPAQAEPAVVAQPAVTASAPVTEPEASAVNTEVASTPSSLPVPGAVTSGLPEGTPVVTAAPVATTTTTTTTTVNPADANKADMHAAVASPATSLNVAVPIASITGSTPLPPVGATSTTTTTVASTSTSTGSGDVHEKLDNLELALKSIDQRLSQVSAGGAGDEKVQRLERLVNDSSAPEMQDVLKDAVKKMKELDRKLERITELQHQVRMLNTDVKMLKEDVVTQTNMVGEQQRLYNDNIQVSQMQEPGPVKMVVQAAIPGRAWLRSERGELLTVIPGDEVPGYGRVVSIDAASGTVVTSSRAVFREQ